MGVNRSRLYLWIHTSGRLSQDEEVNVAMLILWILLVPIIRDIHFYFAHRFAPFSGMCMHPAEHFYYFTCYGPLIWAACHNFAVHPFIVGIHVTLSPAASHSGYEDHWSANLYHYLHHRYYACNFGPSMPFMVFERWMGTYRDRLEPGANEKLSSDPKVTMVVIPEGKTYCVLGVLLPSIALTHFLKGMALVTGIIELCHS